MKGGDSIKIKSVSHRELSTNVIINGRKYLIFTEDLDPKEKLIVTRAYLGGKILLTKKIDRRDFPNEEIIEVARSQHKTIIEILKKEDGLREKSPLDYLNEVKFFLQRKNNRTALAILTQALEQYPSDPFLLSYYGCLEAIINKKYTFGIDTCLKAITLINERKLDDEEVSYSTFYLNLGRAYVAAKKRKEAVDAFQKGLALDRENKDLLWEMSKLGRRRRPALPYLKRANPLNKYIGLILHKMDRLNLKGD